MREGLRIITLCGLVVMLLAACSQKPEDMHRKKLAYRPEQNPSPNFQQFDKKVVQPRYDEYNWPKPQGSSGSGVTENPSDSGPMGLGNLINELLDAVN